MSKSKYIRKEITLDINNGCSIYICSTPKSMQRELINVFPNVTHFQSLKARKKGLKDNVLAIVVVQITKHDMIKHSADIQQERDECLHCFYRIGHLLKEYIGNKEEQKEDINADDENENEQDCDGVKPVDECFVDLVDPMTGKAMMSSAGPSIYDEVDGGSRLLKWKIQQIQFCGVLLHPIHRSNIYPATIFTSHEMEKLETFFSDLDCESVVQYAKMKVAKQNGDEQISVVV